MAAAERFVFTVSRLCQRRSDTGDSEFHPLASQLFGGDKFLTEVTASVHGRTNDNFSREKAITEMRDLFQRGVGTGFYWWEGLRYFQFEYEQHLTEKAGTGTARLNWDEFNKSKKDHVTIEHIYPRTPASGEWPQFDQRSNAERGILCNSLGNLLALSQSRNSKFSNRPFAVKKQDADGVQGYFNGSYSEIAVAQIPEWTPQAVLDRGLAMLEFMEARWNIVLGSRADKLRLLNVEFLEPSS